MGKLLRLKDRHQVKLGHVGGEEAVHRLQVALDRPPQRLPAHAAGFVGRLREAVELQRARHVHVATHRAEADLNQLLGVERAVVVAAGAHRLRNEDARRVERLPDAGQVDTAGDLLDQHRGEPLRAELLVHAEEVDLHGGDGSKRGNTRLGKILFLS